MCAIHSLSTFSRLFNYKLRVSKLNLGVTCLEEDKLKPYVSIVGKTLHLIFERRVKDNMSFVSKSLTTSRSSLVVEFPL